VQVQEAITRNLRRKAVLLIAHRLSTVENADKIVVINKGRVEQIGMVVDYFDELITFFGQVHIMNCSLRTASIVRSYIVRWSVSIFRP